MIDAFRAGGWGMYPTTLVGIGLLLSSLLFALRPARRRIWLVLCLGILTWLGGCIGALVGIINTLMSYALSEPSLALLARGIAESLHNIVLALIILAAGCVVVADGALKVWRGNDG